MKTYNFNAEEYYDLQISLSTRLQRIDKMIEYTEDDKLVEDYIQEKSRIKILKNKLKS